MSTTLATFLRMTLHSLALQFRRTRSRVAYACAVLACFSFIDLCQAAPLVIYEPFAGYTAGNLNAQLPNANTIGLDTTVGWATAGSGAGGATGGIDVVAPGLTFGNLAVKGGAITRAATGVKNTKARIALPAAFTGDLYGSYLVSIGALTAANGAAFTTFEDASAVSTTRRFRTAAETSGADLIATSYSGNTAQTGNGGLVRDTTYIMLSRFTNVGGDTSVTAGTATVFALNAAQFAHFRALGMNDADLDTASNGSADDNVTGKAVASTTTGTISLTNDFFFLLSTTNNAVNTTPATLFFDEFRYGLSFADVTPIDTSNADFDGSGAVDGADFLRWQQGLGLTGAAATLASGNANGDAAVDGTDLDAWKNKFTPAATATLNAVPEPNALILMATCGLVGLNRRRAQA